MLANAETQRSIPFTSRFAACSFLVKHCLPGVYAPQLILRLDCMAHLGQLSTWKKLACDGCISTQACVWQEVKSNEVPRFDAA